MRICVDATSLLLRSAGVKNYTYHWMLSLKAEAPQYDIRAFPMLGEVGDLHHEGSMLSLSETLPRIALLHLCNIRHSPLINFVTTGVDVFHASSLVRNMPKRPRLTGTLYDMTSLIMPEVHTAGNIRAEANFHEQVVRRAHGLIAISAASKNDAVRMLGITPDKVSVIYPGIDQRFFEAEPMVRARPYVLFVGTIEPRKNVDTLLDAWVQLPEELRESHDLILAGPTGWAAEATMARLGSGLKNVDYRGYVPESDLPSLTAGATAFIYPSLYEGFGFPLAQAMAAGVPCITSNVSSMPEVAGEAGILVDPRSSGEIASALKRLLESESLRRDLSIKAREQAKQFTWKNSARLSAKFFERVCA